MDEAEFFDHVLKIVGPVWGATEIVFEGSRSIIGRHDNLLLYEIEPELRDAYPVVRTRTDFARFVPETPQLHENLVRLNREIPIPTFGVEAERRRPETVAVKAHTAVYGDIVNEESINWSIGRCLSATILLLEGGFLEIVGGELGLAATLREMGIATE